MNIVEAFEMVHMYSDSAANTRVRTFAFCRQIVLAIDVTTARNAISTIYLCPRFGNNRGNHANTFIIFSIGWSLVGRTMTRVATFAYYSHTHSLYTLIHSYFGSIDFLLLFIQHFYAEIKCRLSFLPTAFILQKSTE